MGKQIIGIALIIAGVVVGLYVGGYQCFIRGLIQIFTELKAATPLNVEVLVWGIAKVVLAGLAGWLSAFLFIVPGFAILKS